MTHLLKITEPNVFETKVAERPSRNDESGRADYPVPAYAPERPQCFAVGVDMTPEQARDTNMANYPRYDRLDVHNLEPRKRGFHY